jgi:hypothetical protein
MNDKELLNKISEKGWRITSLEERLWEEERMRFTRTKESKKPCGAIENRSEEGKKILERREKVSLDENLAREVAPALLSTGVWFYHEEKIDWIEDRRWSCPFCFKNICKKYVATGHDHTDKSYSVCDCDGAQASGGKKWAELN